MCCQESGEREASVSLFCPKAKQGERKFRKVWTHLIGFFAVFRLAFALGAQIFSCTNYTCSTAHQILIFQPLNGATKAKIFSF